MIKNVSLWKQNKKMNKTISNLLMALVLLLGLYPISIVFETNFFESDTFPVFVKGIVAIVILLFLIGMGYAFYKINTYTLLILSLVAISFSSCTRVKPNESYLYTKDCGDEWHILKQGESLPTNKVANCFYSISLPKTSLLGEVSFLTNFKTGLVTISFNYGYVISDELKYIKKAKFRFSTSDKQHEDGGLNDKIEAAENGLIDLTMKNITQAYVINCVITNYNHSELENKLLDLFNNALQDRGIYIEDLGLTIKMAPETEYAVDAINALNIYKANGEEALGRQIISSRAGVSTIEVNNNSKTENKIAE